MVPRLPLKTLLVFLCISSISSFTLDVSRRPASLALFADKELRPGSLAAATAEQGRVPYGESSRKYRRTVYTHSDWIQHRSEDRLISNLSGIFFSGIVRQLYGEVALVTAVAAAVIVWNGFLVPNFGIATLGLPTQPFTLSSPALGLLLVFRTNASYQRWLEARMKWGVIITQSRNIVRMSSTFAPVDNEIDLLKLEQLIVASWALPRSIMNKLSGAEDDLEYEQEMREKFGGSDGESNNTVSRVIAAPDRALAALMNLSLTLDAIGIDEKRRVEIDKSLVIIGDSLGACERIFTSPVPLVYTRHTARFLSLWMLLLPLAIYDAFAQNSSAFALPMIPAAAILSLFLFGIEELAVQLEEPFSILPMQRFCDGILAANTGLRDWAVESRQTKE